MSRPFLFVRSTITLASTKYGRGCIKLGAFSTASLLASFVRYRTNTTRLDGNDDAETDKMASSGNDEPKKGTLFDFRKLQEAERDAKAHWNSLVGQDPGKVMDDMWKTLVASVKKEEDTETITDSAKTLSSMAADFMSLIQGNHKEDSVSNLIAKARESSEDGDVRDTSSLKEIMAMLTAHKASLQSVAQKFMGSIDFSQISPTALVYYLEYEDERKNPSWKRRMHRFCPGINIDMLFSLNDDCTLALLCYADTAEIIREGLSCHSTPFELIYTQMVSEPGKPANFVALKKNQSPWSSSLEVIMGVRGTKTIADAMTDLLCDVVDYRGGKAHGFIVNSGKYLAEKHSGLLLDLMKSAGKSKIKLKLIGHSLGAGAASIAAMELNDNPKFECKVVGFGCPALLTKEIAEKVTYITTVVNDSDVVPRMSGITAANLILDVMEFDFHEYAKRDIEYSVKELNKRQPLIFNKAITDKIKSVAEPIIERQLKSEVKKDRTERVAPELFPPGKCIHCYRDGSGLTLNVVPNDFFSEIDVNRRMIDDHLFQTGYQQTFLELMRQAKGDLHFRFEDVKK